MDHSFELFAFVSHCIGIRIIMNHELHRRNYESADEQRDQRVDSNLTLQMSHVCGCI